MKKKEYTDDDTLKDIKDQMNQPHRSHTVEEDMEIK